MTLSAGTVSLPVKADTKDFGKQLHDGVMAGAKGVGKALGAGILAGAGAAVAAGAAILHTGIGEAMDAATGTAQLEAGIKSTGGAAGVTVDQLNNLASAIQDYSGQTDDSIVKSEQLLLTFTNIKNVGPNKIFDEATAASADMAAKMGGDASANAILLGKALNDPVKGITALTRVGVSFSEGQKQQIDTMVKHGDVMGAQKIILKELQTEFGGAAKAAGDSLPGQLERGKRAFEDMSQAVVTTILPIVTPAIEGISGAIKKATPFIVAFAQTFINDVKAGIEKAQPFIQGVRDVIGKIADYITGTAIPAIKKFIQQFQDGEGAGGRLRTVLEAIGKYITGTLVPAFKDIVKWVGNHKTLVEGLVIMVIAGVAAFKAYNAIMVVVKAATAAWAVVQGILNGTLITNPIGLIVMAIAALVAGIVWVATKTTFFQDVWSAVWGAVTKAFDNTVNWIKNAAQNVWDFLKKVFGWTPLGLIVENWDKITGFFSGLPGKIGAAVAGLWDGLTDSFKAAINSLIRMWNDFHLTLGGGNILGMKIPSITLDTPDIPYLAAGGIVPATPGGRLVRVAEAGQDEAVVPLPKNANGVPNAGGNVTHNWYVTGPTPEALFKQFTRRQIARGA